MQQNQKLDLLRKHKGIRIIIPLIRKAYWTLIPLKLFKEENNYTSSIKYWVLSFFFHSHLSSAENFIVVRVFFVLDRVYKCHYALKWTTVFLQNCLMTIDNRSFIQWLSSWLHIYRLNLVKHFKQKCNHWLLQKRIFKLSKATNMLISKQQHLFYILIN